MKTHPAAKIFPALEGEPFRELVEDIRSNGLLEPIVLLDGLVLDGRTRLRACKAAGLEPRFKKYDGELDPIEYVRSKNLHRRHLSASQRAAAAALAEKLLESERELAARRRAQAKGRPRGTKNHTSPDSGPGQKCGDSRDRVGEAFGVSGRQVDRARRLRERDPARFEAVKRGDQSIAAALRETRLEELASVFPTDEKRRILELIASTEVTDSKARRMVENLRQQPVEERRRIYSLAASELPREVRVAHAKAMGQPSRSDPILDELKNCARTVKRYARTEFRGNGRVRLFEAADLIEGVLQDEERRLTELYKGIFAGAERSRTNRRSVRVASSTMGSSAPGGR